MSRKEEPSCWNPSQLGHERLSGPTVYPLLRDTPLASMHDVVDLACLGSGKGQGQG